MPADFDLFFYLSSSKMAECRDIVLIAASVATVAATCLVLKSKKKRKPRKVWVRPLFQRRSQFGAYNLLMSELRQCDQDRYKGFTRFSIEEFDELLTLVKSEIEGSQCSIGGFLVLVLPTP